MERTLVLVKPDGVQRGLIGEIISRLERRGLRLVGAKFIQVSQDLAETHYAIHKGKPFYDGLIAYGHDDALISVALCTVLDNQEWPGVGVSAVVETVDELEEIDGAEW